MIGLLISITAVALAPTVQTGSAQLSREEVEQILFDFRDGVASKVKVANVERLAKTGEMYVPLLIECLQWKLPPWLAERIEQTFERQGDEVKIGLSSDGGVPVYAGMTLTRIGAPAVPLLVASLETQPETGGTVARILGDIGDARAIVPLIEILKNKSQNWPYRQEAAHGLQMLDAQDAVPHLIDVLGEPADNLHSSDRLIDTVATALAELTDRSFGFTLVVYKPDMTWDMTPRYTFVCRPEARGKVIAQWKQWWDHQSELRDQVKTYLAKYAGELRDHDIQDIKAMRSNDCTRRIKGRKGRLILVDNPDGEWFDALERPRGSSAGCKDYQISLLNCRDEGDRVIVTAQDKALLMVDGRQVSFVVMVERVLQRQGDLLVVREEDLLKWEPPIFGQ